MSRRLYLDNTNPLHSCYLSYVHRTCKDRGINYIRVIPIIKFVYIIDLWVDLNTLGVLTRFLLIRLWVNFPIRLISQLSSHSHFGFSNPVVAH
jgi:hypothetical protein